jgi:integrase
MKLTTRRIETLTCPADTKDALYFDDEQRGLGVRVTAAGSKTYLAQYTLAGQKRRVPLGSCSAISLAAARAAAQAILGDVAKGRDPAGERKAAAWEAKRRALDDALTLGALIAQWQSLRLSERRERYAAEAVRALRYAFAKHLKAPAADLDRAAVVRVLDNLAKDGKTAMASRTAAYGRACYHWALKRGSLAANPFQDLPLEPVAKRDRVLSDDELRAVWNAAAGPGSFGAIVRVLILTGQRREEVAGMTWDEVAPDLSTWTILASRTKNGVAHLVPLSPGVQDVLRKAPRFAKGEADKQGEAGERDAEDKAQDDDESDFVFPGQRGVFNGFSKSKAELDEASGVRGWRLHDLRRTLATGLQRLGVRLEVTEAVLNHVSGSRAGIVGVYQRHDYAAEKRAALAAWGEHVAAIVDGREAEGNVTAFRARSA